MTDCEFTKKEKSLKDMSMDSLRKEKSQLEGKIKVEENKISALRDSSQNPTCGDGSQYVRSINNHGTTLANLKAKLAAVEQEITQRGKPQFYGCSIHEKANAGFVHG